MPTSAFPHVLERPLDAPEATAAALIPATPAALARQVRVLAGRTDFWRPLLRLDPENRWYTRVAGGDGWEGWLLTWLPGQRTGLHDHGSSAGAFAVLAGEVDEITVGYPAGRRSRLESRRLRSGEIRSFAAPHIHDVTGVGTAPAATLHVYAPELTTMNTYAHEDGLLVRLRSERAGQDW